MVVFHFSCLSVFGLVGNSMAIAVLQKDKERREALFLLQMLAVADLFYLALALLRYPLKYLLPHQETYVTIQVNPPPRPPPPLPLALPLYHYNGVFRQVLCQWDESNLNNMIVHSQKDWLIPLFITISDELSVKLQSGALIYISELPGVIFRSRTTVQRVHISRLLNKHA